MKEYTDLVRGYKFAANSKAAKLLKTGSTEKELATAVKSTKAYAENSELRDATDNVLAGAEKRPEPKPQPTSRSGEPRH